MRRPFRAIVPLTALLVLVVQTAGAAGLVHGQGRLWRVEGATDEAPSYVFGTIHSDREAVLDLAPAIERSFAEAQRYAFELDFDAPVMQKMARAMMDRSGRPLSARLDEQAWQRLAALARDRGIPPQRLDRMAAWAVAVTLSVPRVQPSATLDRVLFRRAKQRGRPVEGLETIDEQIQVFAGLSQETQMDILRQVIELAAADRIEPMFERVTQAWLAGDLARIVELSEANPMLPDPRSQQRLQQRLVDERNARMSERMQPLIERGGAFIAIGALHLPGEAGVLRRLERAGYSVERVE